MLPREIPPFFRFLARNTDSKQWQRQRGSGNGVAWAVGRAVCDYLFGQLMFHRAWAPGLSMAVKMETIGERFLPQRKPRACAGWGVGKGQEGLMGQTDASRDLPPRGMGTDLASPHPPSRDLPPRGMGRDGPRIPSSTVPPLTRTRRLLSRGSGPVHVEAAAGSGGWRGSGTDRKSRARARLSSDFATGGMALKLLRSARRAAARQFRVRAARGSRVGTAKLQSTTTIASGAPGTHFSRLNFYR